MSETDNTIEIYKAISLPKGKVAHVVPKLVHNNKVYAYELKFNISDRLSILADARQAPIDVQTLQGRYGEMGLYITEIEAISLEPLPDALHCQYLGSQMSMVFFQELLDRYYMLRHEADNLAPGEQDSVPEFQSYYDEVLADYHPLGFPLGAYVSEQVVNTAEGAFLLAAKAKDQIEATVSPGEWLYLRPGKFSFASFKELS